MRSILITGCSSGIGLMAAKALRQRGYQVIASCRKAQDVERLRQQGFIAIELDVNDSESIQRAVQQVAQLTQGRLDALFNNAGYGVYGQLASISRQQLEQQFATNLFGVHELTMALLPLLKAAGEARIIQTSSVMGLISTPGRGAYAASKYALEAWSDALRLELYATSIKVSLIEPGPIATAFSQNVTQTQAQKVENPPIAKRFALTADAILPKLLHALESKHPKIRYRVTLVSQVSALLKRLLPDRWLDAILHNK